MSLRVFRNYEDLYALGRRLEDQPRALLVFAAMLFLPGGNICAQTVTVDGSQVFQTIEGYGVNVNHRSWTNNELPPVLDAFIDQAGMTLFRIIWTIRIGRRPTTTPTPM